MPKSGRKQQRGGSWEDNPTKLSRRARENSCEYEDLEDVLHFAKNMMNSDLDIQYIERGHRVGRPNSADRFTS